MVIQEDTLCPMELWMVLSKYWSRLSCQSEAGSLLYDSFQEKFVLAKNDVLCWIKHINHILEHVECLGLHQFSCIRQILFTYILKLLKDNYT